MDPDFPEVVITRKRKRYRQPVDPCLGYYEQDSAHSDQSNQLPKAVVTKPLRPVTSLPQPPWISKAEVKGYRSSKVISSDYESTCDIRDSSPPPLTVEDFLKETGKFVRRKYQHRKRQVILDSDDLAQDEAPQPEHPTDDPDSPPTRKCARIGRRTARRQSDNDDDSDYQPSSPDSPPSPQALPRKRKVAKVPLAKRLLAAAIMSDVNPVDSLITGHSGTKNTSQRRPLRFHRFQPESPPPRPRTWSLADPRKTNPFDSLTCAVNPSQKRPSRPRKPLSMWEMPSQSSSVPGPSPLKHKPKPVVLHRPERTQISRPKLTFVPVSVTELSYTFRRKATVVPSASGLSTRSPVPLLMTPVHPSTLFSN